MTQEAAMMCTIACVALQTECSPDFGVACRTGIWFCCGSTCCQSLALNTQAYNWQMGKNTGRQICSPAYVVLDKELQQPLQIPGRQFSV